MAVDVVTIVPERESFMKGLSGKENRIGQAGREAMKELWKKFSKIENKIMDKIAYPVLALLILLFIYSQWGHWKTWLWEVSSLLLYVALACGIVVSVVFALLYPAERKKREQLEQELELLKQKQRQERDEP
ncbi:MAG: hypothetical protein AB1424_17080 [Thermodesulfobacteriota bacterium]